MNAEKLYQKHVTQGPDSLTLEETTAALAFRDGNPEAAHRIRARHEAEQREAGERELLRGAWLAKGGDPKGFEREYPRLRQEHDAARLREMERGAREEAARLAWRGF